MCQGKSPQFYETKAFEGYIREFRDTERRRRVAKTPRKTLKLPEAPKRLPRCFNTSHIPVQVEGAGTFHHVIVEYLIFM